jgi:hypothetical protein
MTLLALLHALAARDIGISARDGKLILDAPAGAVTPELRADLTACKPSLLALLDGRWVIPDLTSEEAAAIGAILDWALDDRTSISDVIESGRQWNQVVMKSRSWDL